MMMMIDLLAALPMLSGPHYRATKSTQLPPLLSSAPYGLLHDMHAYDCYLRCQKTKKPTK